MIKPKVYHNTLTADTAYTFQFDVDGSTFLVKNFTDSDLQLSYGDAIDDSSYILIPPKIKQIVCSTFTTTPETETDKITVLSASDGMVEIQILEY